MLTSAFPRKLHGSYILNSESSTKSFCKPLAY